jgi:hypothetical protein
MDGKLPHLTRQVSVTRGETKPRNLEIARENANY